MTQALWQRECVRRNGGTVEQAERPEADWLGGSGRSSAHNGGRGPRRNCSPGVAVSLPPSWWDLGWCVVGGPVTAAPRGHVIACSDGEETVSQQRMWVTLQSWDLGKFYHITLAGCYNFIQSSMDGSSKAIVYSTVFNYYQIGRQNWH